MVTSSASAMFTQGYMVEAWPVTVAGSAGPGAQFTQGYIDQIVEDEPVPPYSGPPLTSAPSGNASTGGGWGGAMPGIRRAIAAEEAEARARIRAAKAVEAAKAVGSGLGATTAAPVPTAVSGAVKTAAVAAAVGAATAAVTALTLKKNKKSRENPDAGVPVVADDFDLRAPRAPSAPLPVAEGDPTGRPCWTCKKRQPYSAYAALPSERPGTKRVCLTCRRGDLERVFERACVMCGILFETGSQKANSCSEKCRVARIEQNRVARRERRRHKEGDE